MRLWYAGGGLIVALPVLIWFGSTVGLPRFFYEAAIHPLQMLQALPVPELTLPETLTRFHLVYFFINLEFRLYALLYLALALWLGWRLLGAVSERRSFEEPLLLATVALGRHLFHPLLRPRRRAPPGLRDPPGLPAARPDGSSRPSTLARARRGDRDRDRRIRSLVLPARRGHGLSRPLRGSGGGVHRGDPLEPAEAHRQDPGVVEARASGCWISPRLPCCWWSPIGSGPATATW